jgi:hypothetical protein
MIAAFRVTSTFLAEVAMDRDKQAIITDLVAGAEKLGLEAGDYAIYDLPDLNLKAVVRFHSRIIHVMTCEEAARTKLPGCGRPESGRLPRHSRITSAAESPCRTWARRPATSRCRAGASCLGGTLGG